MGTLSNHGHRLLQLGALLLLFGMLAGFALAFSAFPRALLGLTAHLTGVMQGILLILIGLIWPKLALTDRVSAFGFWMAVYNSLVSFVVTLLAALWGIGGSVMPIAAEGAKSTDIRERIIEIGLQSSAVTAFAVLTLVLWGLRHRPFGRQDGEP